MSKADNILKKLKSLENERNRKGMERFGIQTKNAYGIAIPILRRMAREIGTDHRLAVQLWNFRVHEARLLASFIDDPTKVTERQMDRWARDFDSWDICDQCCGFLFDRTSYAYGKALQWSKRKEEFLKRAGFVLMAALAVHDKEADDAAFIKFLPRIREESLDERNFVRKAVNWALRQTECLLE
jgi:3-methyladenine DNA glycosylase AlkD